MQDPPTAAEDQPPHRRPALLIVSPRPPKRDGTGDQGRAYQAIQALSDAWDIEVVSWLEPGGAGTLSALKRIPVRSIPSLAVSLLRLPLPVAYSRALAPRRRLAEAIRKSDLTLYITDRAVAGDAPPGFVIDFVDNLAGAALRRSETGRSLRRAFWRWQAALTRRLDNRLVRQAVVSIAVGRRDAAALGSQVQCIPSMVPAAGVGDAAGSSSGRITFTGNLFFGPNEEAGIWICEQLVPALAAKGVQAGKVTIAGRRPSPTLKQAAEKSGVRLMADVDDMNQVLAASSVVIAPMRLGSGIKIKILEAVTAGKPCVVTPEANEGIGLVDGESGIVRNRQADEFAAAVMDLLEDPELQRRIAGCAARQLSTHSQEAVVGLWRSHLEPLRAALTGRAE